MKPVAYPKHNRSPSFHNDTSPCSSTTPNDLFISQKMDYIEQFLSKFDNRLAKLEVTAKSPRDDRSFSSQKKSTEGSCLDFDHKLRAVEDGLFLTKNETSKRLSTLEDHIRDLTKKTVTGMSTIPLPPSRSNSDVSKQGEYNINDRISGIERRVDGMDKRLEQLASSLETFMQRIEGSLGGAPPRQEARREIRHQNRQGEEDLLTEVRLLGTGSSNGIRESEGQSRFEDSYQKQRRGVSRDMPDQSGRFRDEIKSPEIERVERVERVKRGERVERVERVERHEGNETRKLSDMRTPVREPVEQYERKRDEGKYNERHVERPTLELRPPARDYLRETKGSLKSPDTERKRKNVSWIETYPSEGNVETENANKRSKVETCEDEVENLRRSSLNQSLNGRERERPRSAIKPREGVEDSKYKYEGRGQRAPSAAREETPGYMRYSGEIRREKVEERNERVEERNIERGENSTSNGNDKERLMEEKRKKIDEEIERRISKQIEMKKKVDVAVEGQKKIYEKASQIEDDFKLSPYSTEKSRDKEVVSRLVREKQLRSDLITKYSENAPESGRKSKSPLRK